MQVIARGLALERGRALDWLTRRQISAETWRTNGWEAGQAGARGQRAIRLTPAPPWPGRLNSRPYKEALKVCLNV